MAAMVNDRDVLIQGGLRDTDPRAGKYIRLTATPTSIFHVDTDGVPSPATITLQALPVGFGGDVTFSAPSGVLKGTGNIRTLDFFDMQADYIEVTASMVFDGLSYSEKIGISKVQDADAASGGTGPAGDKYATAYLYKWSTASSMALPTGKSTLSWNTGANTSYTGTDGWFITPPANPGTSGIKLWVASKPVTAPGASFTTEVSYSTGATVSVYTQNGEAGPAGAKTAQAKAYRWGDGAMPTISGTATFTFATNTYDTVPSGWTKEKGNAASLGLTLYEATVNLVDAAGATTSAINWVNAAITAIGYLGLNGTPGVTGDSATVAYTLIDGNSLAQTPDSVTRPDKSLPAIGTWGETRAWTSQPVLPGAGQSVWQSNGIYNSQLKTTTWSVPYLSNLRVGSLSAISANLGAINAGSMNINNKFTVSTTGDVVAKSIAIQTDGGVTILSSGVPLNPAYAAAGTKNSEIVIGGRNLFPDGDFERSIHTLYGANYDTVSTDASVDPISGTKVLFMQGSGADMYVYLGTKINVTPGKEYRISFYARTATSGTIVGSSSYLKMLNSSGAIVDHSILPMDNLGAGTWKRQVVAWTCPSGVTQIEPRFGITTNSKYSWLAIDCLQIEEGNKETQWTPAVEDLATAAALAGKLDNGSSILKGVLSVNTTYAAGLRVGDITWGANGVRTGGSGVAITPGGLVGFSPAGVNTFRIDASTGAAFFNGTLGANVVKAGNIEAGAVTASSVQIGGDLNNLIRDPRFKDLKWWGLIDPPNTGVNTGVTPVDWNGTAQGSWPRGNVSTYFQSTGGAQYNTQTKTMPLVPGGTYLVEYDLLFHNDWDGDFSVWFHVNGWNGNLLGGLGIVPDSPYKFADGNGIQYPAYTREWRRVSAVITIPTNIPSATEGSFLILRSIRSGSVEMGSINLIRLTDSVLIKDGAITASKISVNSLQAVSAQLGNVRVDNGGAVCGGSFTGNAWPAPGLRGFYLGDPGLLLGNANNGKYFQATSDGNVYMPGFSHENGQLTLTNTVIVTPKLRTDFFISVGNLYLNSQVNTSSYQTFGLDAVLNNGTGPYRYTWSFQMEEGDIAMGADPSNTSGIVRARGTNRICSGFLTCTVTDANGATHSDSGYVRIQFGNGVPV